MLRQPSNGTQHGPQDQTRHINNAYLIAYMAKLNFTAERMADIAMCSQSSIEGYRSSPGTSRYQVLKNKNLVFIDTMIIAGRFATKERLAEIKAGA